MEDFVTAVRAALDDVLPPAGFHPSGGADGRIHGRFEVDELGFGLPAIRQALVELLATTAS